MIRYSDSASGLTPAQLTGGFFEGWPNPPTPETHLRLLQGSACVVLAIEGEQVVGFVTAISDGVLCAYIPFLEVLPAFRGQGIGRELVRRILGRLDLYMVDLVCDEEMAGFYERLDFVKVRAMARRNYRRQAGGE